MLERDRRRHDGRAPPRHVDGLGGQHLVGAAGARSASATPTWSTTTIRSIRLGTSGVYAPTYAISIPGNNPEDTIVRLSDGTPLAAPDALGLGLQARPLPLPARHGRRGAGSIGGWAVNCEYYFRLLDDFRGTGTFERSSIFDHGGMGYLSWCFVPRTYEVYGRSSVVTGPYGTGQEYGGGLNWYVNRSRQARLTFEALYMNRNPAQNILYPYRAGYTGTAIQTQFMMIF